MKVILVALLVVAGLAGCNANDRQGVILGEDFAYAVPSQLLESAPSTVDALYGRAPEGADSASVHSLRIPIEIGSSESTVSVELQALIFDDKAYGESNLRNLALAGDGPFTPDRFGYFFRQEQVGSTEVKTFSTIGAAGPASPGYTGRHFVVRRSLVEPFTVGDGAIAPTPGCSYYLIIDGLLIQAFEAKVCCEEQFDEVITALDRTFNQWRIFRP